MKSGQLWKAFFLCYEVFYFFLKDFTQYIKGLYKHSVSYLFLSLSVRKSASTDEEWVSVGSRCEICYVGTDLYIQGKSDERSEGNWQFYTLKKC